MTDPAGPAPPPAPADLADGNAAVAALEASYPTAEGKAYGSTATSLAPAAQMAEDLDVVGADEVRLKGGVLVGVAMAKTMATVAAGVRDGKGIGEAQA